MSYHLIKGDNMKQPISYQVLDIQTGYAVKTCKTRNGATRAADIRDKNYGAVRFVVKPVY